LFEGVICVDVFFFNAVNQSWLAVHYDTPNSVYISPSFSIIAGITIADPSYACQPPSNVSGKIALVSFGYCSIETKARNVQAAGGVAMILNEGAVLYPGYNNYIIDGSSVSDIKIGVAFITGQDAMQLTSIVQNYTLVIAYLTTTDPNYWRDVLSSPFNIAVGFFLAACGIFIASFAAFKIFWFLKIKGFRLEAPLLCLSLYFIAAAVLGIFMVFYAIHYGFHPIISLVASEVLLGISGYVVFIALAIVVFHWLDAMKKVKIEKPWLRRLSVPMLIIACLLLLAEIVTGVLAGLYITNIGAEANVIIFLIALVATSTLFIIVGFQIRRTLKKQNDTVVQRRIDRVQRFTKLILWTSVWLVLYTLSLILYVTPLLLEPPSFVVLIFAASFFSYLVTLTQIYIFRRPEDSQSTGTSKRSGEGSNTGDILSSRQKSDQR
jgi:hypothetical protein